MATSECVHPESKRDPIQWTHEELNTVATRRCAACDQVLYVAVQFDGEDESIRKEMERALRGPLVIG